MDNQTKKEGQKYSNNIIDSMQNKLAGLFKNKQNEV